MNNDLYKTQHNTQKNPFIFIYFCEKERGRGQRIRASVCHMWGRGSNPSFYPFYLLSSFSQAAESPTWIFPFVILLSRSKDSSLCSLCTSLMSFIKNSSHHSSSSWLTCLPWVRARQGSDGSWSLHTSCGNVYTDIHMWKRREAELFLPLHF